VALGLKAGDQEPVIPSLEVLVKGLDLRRIEEGWVEGWCSKWSNGDGQSCCIRTLTGVGCEGISCSGIGVEGWRPRARNTFIGGICQRIRPSGTLGWDSVEGRCSECDGNGQSCCKSTLTGLGVKV
jgi:hypothetical protein